MSKPAMVESRMSSPSPSVPDRDVRLRRAEQVPTRALALRWRECGDRWARDALIDRYQPLARRLARRYLTSAEPVDDLVQVASVGLVAAVDRFDPHRGIPFTGFAIPTILGELKRYFRDAGWSAHVPRRAQEMALRVDQASRELGARTGRAPSVGELAQYLELDTEQVLAGLEAGSAHFAMSLDAPVATTDIEESPCRSRLRSSVRPSGARSAIRRCIRVTLQRSCPGGGPCPLVGFADAAHPF